MNWTTMNPTTAAQPGQWPLAVALAGLLTAGLTWAIYDPARMPLAVGIHLATVLPALVVGTVMLLMAKGTPLHRFLGRQWVVLMGTTALVSFFILDDGVSWIHGLSAFTLTGLVIAVRAAPHDRMQHACWMIGIYLGAWIAGVFAALLPGRFLHALLFG